MDRGCDGVVAARCRARVSDRRHAQMTPLDDSNTRNYMHTRNLDVAHSPSTFYIKITIPNSVMTVFDLCAAETM